MQNRKLEPEEWWLFRFNASMPGGSYQPTTGYPLTRERALRSFWHIFDKLNRVFLQKKSRTCAALGESYCRVCAHYIFFPEKILPEDILRRMLSTLMKVWENESTNPSRTETK